MAPNNVPCCQASTHPPNLFFFFKEWVITLSVQNDMDLQAVYVNINVHIYQNLEKGAKWFLKGVYSPFLRV